MPVPQKPPNGKACRGIGVSFSPADIEWLNATYGGGTSITDKVRSALYEAKCWRYHLLTEDEKKIANAVKEPEPHDVPVAADKVATERITNG